MSDFNEPAYPVQGFKYDDRLGGQLFHGLTIRQTAVLMAMQGILANPTYIWKVESVAQAALGVADAVLRAERESRE